LTILLYLALLGSTWLGLVVVEWPRSRDSCPRLSCGEEDEDGEEERRRE